ncbi:sensor histidine kinase, partial [Zoogloea sp.]|uniref:sensor histidine kinase n=1 Tax=Zoogloea sp. TaxID=49181 RepID=UPI00260ECE1F
MTRSLRKALLLWLLLPAALALITFLPLAFHLVHQPAMEALDQALADASLALVPHLEIGKDGPHFVFPPAAEQVLRSDRVDDIYYLVLGPGERFIAGDAGLPHEPPDPEQGLKDRVSFDAHFRNHPIRVTTIHRQVDQAPFVFVVAETTRKRDQLKVDLAFALILPLVFFAAATGATIWFGINHALIPVEGIRRALHNMGHGALLPLDESAAPAEIRPLVGEFNQLLERLEQASAAQQRFVANAAHQLRTPLAGIRTQLELIPGDHDTASRDSRARQCIGAIDRLSHLVNQMLV